jgi:hypothetical protein
MISDPDIWRAAQLLINRHGEDAPIVAAERVVELTNAEDFSGAAVRKGILQAVDEFQRVSPKAGERVN